MSDDEVLNLSGWGIPTRIARARAPRGWEEEWTYAVSGAPERLLRFSNAWLAEIVEGAANESVQLAQR